MKIQANDINKLVCPQIGCNKQVSMQELTTLFQDSEPQILEKLQVYVKKQQ